MSRTAEEFRAQAKERGITKWVVHHCSICNYECGYVIQGDDVFYDSGCNCVRMTPLQRRSWEDLAFFYNIQKNENVIAQMDKLWGFSSGMVSSQSQA